MENKNKRVLEVVASIASIIGVFLIATGRPQYGFILSLIASGVYAVYAFLTGQYFFALSSCAYFIVDIIGLFHWWSRQ